MHRQLLSRATASGFTVGALATLITLGAMSYTTSDSTPRAVQDPQDLSKMMEKMKRFTTPGPEHEALARFIGTWDAQATMTMHGQNVPFAKGTAAFSWLIEGRWLSGKMEAKMSGAMGNAPMQSHLTMGYDRFKRSYVTAQVQSLDTALLTSEGDMDPSGKALVTYGTLDEYLTGEHDKMVKYIWRFESEDKIVLEVHDLPIGLRGTKVFETIYTRR